MLSLWSVSSGDTYWAYSTDGGDSWADGTLMADLYSLAYNGTVWCAAGDADIYTFNGTSWTAQTPPALWAGARLIVMGTRFFGYPSVGDGWLSTNNGVTFTSIAMPAVGVRQFGAAYNGTACIIPGNGGSFGNNKLALSTNDGDSWSEVSTGVSSGVPLAIGTEFRMFGGGSPGNKVSTNNGATWTELFYPNVSIDGNNACGAIGRYAAIAQGYETLQFGTDGSDWRYLLLAPEGLFFYGGANSMAHNPVTGAFYVATDDFELHKIVYEPVPNYTLLPGVPQRMDGESLFNFTLVDATAASLVFSQDPDAYGYADAYIEKDGPPSWDSVLYIGDVAATPSLQALDAPLAGVYNGWVETYAHRGAVVTLNITGPFWTAFINSQAI